ncbi:MAG TPA: hypothetical protein VE621_18470, partial [Bryobacteraceae bacterium]|nr:hypothetical protein [Bryobacteraceae bacterium]
RNQPSALSPSTLTQVNDLSTRYDVFMLTNAVPSQIVGLPQPGQGRGNSNLNPQILQSIEQISGGLTFGANVVIAAEATTRSDRDAVALADVLRFLASMAQMNRDRPEAAQFAGLLDTLELNTRANVTTVRLSVPQSRIEDLIRQKKGVRKASYVH